MCCELFVYDFECGGVIGDWVFVMMGGVEYGGYCVVIGFWMDGV